MALLGLALFVAGLCLVPLQETDLFFRLANGQEILRTGHVPGRNLFSFTFPDQPYLDSAWLFDVATAALYRLGGFPAVVAGKTAIVVATFVAAYLLLRRRGSGRVIAALVLAAAAFCMRERLVERPHVVSLLGEVVVLALLPALQDGRRRAWLLVLVVALWANLHAGAFIGPLLIALAGLGLLLEGIITRSPVPRRAVFNHALAAALCTLALMATPAGSGIFRYLAFHADIFTIHPVDEFRSPAWHSDAPLLIYAVALALSFGLCAARRVRPRARDLLPVLGLALLAGRYVRFGADFALLAAILAAPLLTTFGAHWPARLGPAYQAQIERAGGALLALLALVPRVADVERHGRFLDIDLDRANLPWAALRFVDQHGLRERMYNDFETGAFLIWEGYPRYRVFVDPRLPAYPRAFHQLLGRSDIPRDEWTRAMDHFGVTSALLDYAGVNRRVAWWDPEQWALVFRAHEHACSCAGCRPRTISLPATRFPPVSPSQPKRAARPRHWPRLRLARQCRFANGSSAWAISSSISIAATTSARSTPTDRRWTRRRGASRPSGRQPPALGSARSIGPPAEPSRRWLSSIAVWPSCLTIPRC
jgi:hypothetical protein